MREMQEHPDIKATLLHTGQHYDRKMSELFFDELRLPQPDIFLGIGSAGHGTQTGKIMIDFEQVLLKDRPDMVVVVGDVNSTIACGLVAVKLGIKLAHVEAGLRSFDRTMPEEINRILTDQISDLLFITEKSGEVNLLNEGVPADRIHFVGNVMIDTLLHHRERAEASNILGGLNLHPKRYAVLTLHRPSNVDSKENLSEIFRALQQIQKDIKIIFPVHPRSHARIKEFGLSKMVGEMPQLVLCDPLGYLDFLKLMSEALFLLTDSGGIQEESTVLGVPCLTLRDNTERPVTVEQGSNLIIGASSERITSESRNILNGKAKQGRVPDLWDGKAAQRIVEIIASQL